MSDDDSGPNELSMNWILSAVELTIEDTMCFSAAYLRVSSARRVRQAAPLQVSVVRELPAGMSGTHGAGWSHK